MPDHLDDYRNPMEPAVEPRSTAGNSQGPYRSFQEFSEEDAAARRMETLSRLRFLMENRGFLLRVFLISVLISTLITLLISNRYEAVERLMPPDGQSASMGAAMLTALMGRGTGGGGAGLGSIAGDLMGMKNAGALFVGILQSR